MTLNEVKLDALSQKQDLHYTPVCNIIILNIFSMFYLNSANLVPVHIGHGFIFLETFLH